MLVGFCLCIFVFNVYNVVNCVICIFDYLIVGWFGVNNCKMFIFLEYIDDNNGCFIFFIRCNIK